MNSTLKTVGIFVIGFIFGLSGASAQTLDIDKMGPGLHRMEVTHSNGTLQRYMIDIPEGYDGSEAVPLILGLHHGFSPMEGSNIRDPYKAEEFYKRIYQQAFKPLGAIFLAADSVNGNWATPENETALSSLIDSVLNTYNIDERKTIVTGYSMGGFGSWHWASKYQERFAGVLPIAGMPADMNSFRQERKMLDVDWTIPIYIIHSNVDGLIDIEPTREYVKKLQSEGKDVTFQELTVLTHHQEDLLPEPVGQSVPWIKRVWQNVK